MIHKVRNMLTLLKELYLTFKSIFSHEERFYINVPYAEKNAAKELGAKWDPQKKSWFIPKELDQLYFKKWLQENNNKNLDADIRSNGFFIVESLEQCWRCRQITSVFAFLLPEDHQVKNYDENADDDTPIWVTAGYKVILGFIRFLNKECLETIQKISSHYYFDFSKTASSSYYMNHCRNCNSRLGDFYMHSEPGGAFSPMTCEQAGDIKLYWYNKLFESSAGTSSVDVDHFESMQIIS